MTSYEMLYKELRKLVLKIKKEGAFSNYTANDFFYLEDEKKERFCCLRKKYLTATEFKFLPAIPL